MSRIRSRPESLVMPSSQDPSTPTSTLGIVLAVGLALLISASAIWLLTPPSKPKVIASSDTDQELAERIRPVGQVRLASTETASSSGPKTGEAVFKTRCAACHATGAMGAPKFGDSTAWAPRIKTGLDALVTSALKGKNAMPAQGGRDLSDAEIRSGVIYMANAGGATFAEPKTSGKP
jgi:cytochrome c5